MNADYIAAWAFLSIPAAFIAAIFVGLTYDAIIAIAALIG